MSESPTSLSEETGRRLAEAMERVACALEREGANMPSLPERLSAAEKEYVANAILRGPEWVTADNRRRAGRARSEAARKKREAKEKNHEKNF